MNQGVRTPDSQKKSLRKKFRRLLLFATGEEGVISMGFEPMTHSLEGCCSIQLSYETGSIPRIALQNYNNLWTQPNV